MKLLTATEATVRHEIKPESTKLVYDSIWLFLVHINFLYNDIRKMHIIDYQRVMLHFFLPFSIFVTRTETF